MRRSRHSAHATLRVILSIKTCAQPDHFGAEYPVGAKVKDVEAKRIRLSTCKAKATSMLAAPAKRDIAQGSGAFTRRGRASTLRRSAWVSVQCS